MTGAQAAAADLPVVAVVIPTIRGREALLQRTVKGYKASEGRLRIKTIVVKGAPTIGQAWQAGRAGAAEEGARYVHLAADDVVPHHGAMLAAIDAVLDGVYPSPRILNPDGSLHSCGSLGAGMLLPEVEDGAPAVSSGFPFFAAELLDRIGVIPPVHYYADDWLAMEARRLGMQPRVVRAFELLHLEGVPGRLAVQQRAMRDRATSLAAMGRPLAAKEGSA